MGWRPPERNTPLCVAPRPEAWLEKYVARMVERLRDTIVSDDSEGEPPVLPVLNRCKPNGTTAEVDFKTTRPCYMTQRSHVNQVVADMMSWEGSAAFRLEQGQAVKWYVRNDHLGLVIPYEYLGVDHSYEPDFLVRLASDVILVLEVKGFEDNQSKAEHDAAKRWVMAANNWGQLGRWDFHVCRNPLLLDKERAFLIRA